MTGKYFGRSVLTDCSFFRALCENVPKNVNDIVSCLLQSLQSSYDTQRVAATAIFAEVRIVLLVFVSFSDLFNMQKELNIVLLKWS